MCELLREKNKNIKIVLGGSGLFQGGLNGRDSMAVDMLDENLCDYYIKSEGETALVELMKGNDNYPGINMNFYEQIIDLGSMPTPNFSDYDLTDYPEQVMPITFSRGCVRKCTFCDIHEHWAKYTFRKGQDVADEVIKLHQEHGFKNFYFTDSLINGALKEFYKFVDILADYNNKLHKKDRISYTGQYIIRSEKFHRKDYWKKLKESGATYLAFGVESGSERVRNHMEKGFSDEDVEYTMRMLKKYNITCHWSLFVGYPTETNEDFEATLRMFEKYKDLAGNIVAGISITLMGILPGTPIYKRVNELNITIDPKHEVNFIAHDNPSLTIEERVNRFRTAISRAQELNYSISEDLIGILKVVDDYLDTYKKRATVLKKMYAINEIK